MTPLLPARWMARGWPPSPARRRRCLNDERWSFRTAQLRRRVARRAAGEGLLLLPQPQLAAVAVAAALGPSSKVPQTAEAVMMRRLWRIESLRATKPRLQVTTRSPVLPASPLLLLQLPVKRAQL